MRAKATPRRFLTLTGNLLAERTQTFTAWAPGRTQRAAAESFQVGGKGVNVARMLQRLRTPATALVFTGGSSGQECEAWLRERALAFRAFPAAGSTRTGLVVRGGRRGETTFLGPDALPSAAGLRACAAFLDRQPRGGVLAVCGSLPGWDGQRFAPLRAAFERWLRRGVLVVDTYGAPLAWFARRPVALIKINRGELTGLGLSFGDLPGSSPVQAWIVTDGPKAVQVLDEDGRRHRLVPPRIRPVSPTGSGDVLLACLLHARYVQGLPWEKAAAFALPYAAANAAHPGVAEFPFSLALRR